MKRILALVPMSPGMHRDSAAPLSSGERPLREAGFDLEYAPFETRALRNVLGQKGRTLRKALEMLRAYSKRGPDRYVTSAVSTVSMSTARQPSSGRPFRRDGSSPAAPPNHLLPRRPPLRALREPGKRMVVILEVLRQGRHYLSAQ